jgi:ankyrin repeat protein
MTTDNHWEKEVFGTVCSDNAKEFQRLLATNHNFSFRFRGDWIDGDVIDIYQKSVAEVVVIKNALQIGEVFFGLEGVEAQFEYKAAIAYAVLFGTPDMIRLMVRKGFDPNKKRHTEPPLLIAAIKGDFEACEAMMASGQCNPYVKDQYGRVEKEDRPLCEAARQGGLDIVKLIVEFKKDKRTLVRAAIVAANNGHEAVALYLLDQLANGRKKGSTQDYPYHIIIPAARHEMMRIVERLIKEEPRTLHLVNANETALSVACKYNKINLAKYLISQGSDVHATDESKYYVYTGSEFIECGAEELWNSPYAPPPHAHEMKIALPLSRESPSSPLAEAAASGNLEIVELLIANGVGPETAYMKSARRPGLKLEMTYDVPAIELARHFGHTSVVDYLSKTRAINESR